MWDLICQLQEVSSRFLVHSVEKDSEAEFQAQQENSGMMECAQERGPEA